MFSGTCHDLGNYRNTRKLEDKHWGKNQLDNGEGDKDEVKYTRATEYS